MDRRELFTVGAAVGTVFAADTLVGCTPAQEQQFEQMLADVINKVQKAVKAACTAAPFIVPTADSVFRVLVSLLPNAMIYTAGEAVIKQAVEYIISVGCPAPGTASAAAINGKTVHIDFL